MDEVLEKLLTEHRELVNNKLKLHESKASFDDLDDADFKVGKSYCRLVDYLDEHYDLTTDVLDEILFDNKSMSEIYELLGYKNE